MSISCSDLLAFAQKLQSATDETELRASVSRAYYAAYHKADQWHETLPAQGFAPNGMGVHKTLLTCLLNPNVPGPQSLRSRSIGYVLKDMKASRQKADYYLDQTVDKAEAATTVTCAANLISKC